MRYILRMLGRLWVVPLNAVKKRAGRYAVLVPGDVKKSVIAGKLAQVFDMPVEFVDMVLPPGDVTVAETVGFTLI